MSARYRVMQRRGGRTAEEAVELASTRRYNGALAVRDAQADSARGHLKGHASKVDRVVTGPTNDVPDGITTVLVGPNVLRWVTTWVEQI